MPEPSYQELQCSSVASAIDAIRGLPEEVTKVKLVLRGQDNLTAPELHEIFSALPERIKGLTVSIKGLTFDRLGPSGFKFAFQGLPQSLEHLAWVDDNLFLDSHISITELQVAFSGLPLKIKNVYHPDAGVIFKNVNDDILICLNTNESVFQAVSVIRALPIGVTKLKIKVNSWIELSSEVLFELFADLPESISELDLSDNSIGLYNVGGFGLKHAFRALPQSLRVLNLRDNSFHQLSDLEVCEAFSGLPKHLKFVDLSNAGVIYERSIDEIEMALSVLPKSITKIKFHQVEMLAKTQEELRELSYVLFCKLCFAEVFTISPQFIFGDLQKSKFDALYSCGRQKQINAFVDVVSHQNPQGTDDKENIYSFFRSFENPDLVRDLLMPHANYLQDRTKEEPDTTKTELGCHLM